MKACREKWFQNHRATILHTAPELTLYEWKAPGTWNHGMRFILHSRWLSILGDIGEATYEWSGTLSPGFLCEIGFNYFRSKCCASEEGRQFDHFDADLGRLALHEWLADAGAEMQDPIKDLIEGVSNCSGLDDWEEAIRRWYDDYAVDGEDMSVARSMALFPHPRQIGHFVGVQMALKEAHQL